jgi:hypothetical protein
MLRKLLLGSIIVTLSIVSINPKAQAGAYDYEIERCASENSKSIAIYSACLRKYRNIRKSYERDYIDQVYPQQRKTTGNPYFQNNNSQFRNYNSVNSGRSNYDYNDGGNYSQEGCIYQHGRKYCPIGH